MIEENPATDGDEAPAEPTKDDLLEEARELDVEGRSSMNKEELAAAIEQKRSEPEADLGGDQGEASDDNDAGDPSDVGGDELPVSEVEASVDPEAQLADGVTLNDDGEVQPVAPESISAEDGGETEVLAGDVEPEPLNSGDELPAHRRQVEGVE